MSYRPIGKQVLVRPQSSSKTRPSGLVLPDSAVKRVFRAEVLRLSDAIKHSEVRPGDTVAYHEHAYERKVPDGEGGQNCLIDYEDIQAVLT